MAFSKELAPEGEHVLALEIVPFPRRFAFDSWGQLFLASGIGPVGEGDDTIVAFTPDFELRRCSDPSSSGRSPPRHTPDARILH
jgi:hypothetical protein